MNKEPDEIRAEIEETRQELAQDVDVLSTKVNPKEAARRKVGRMSEAVSSFKDKVKSGAAEKLAGASQNADAAKGSVADNVSELKENVEEVALNTKETIKAAPAQVKSRAQDNLIVSGLVVFALGWAVGSLMPSSRKEAELYAKAKPALNDAAAPVKAVALDLKEDLSKTASSSLETLKESVSESLGSLKEQGAEAAGTIKDEGLHSAQAVKERSSDSAEREPSPARG